MDIAIILVITAAVAIYIALPFFLRRNSDANDTAVTPDFYKDDPVADKIKTLENQKESLFSAIKDIDFDYGLGKLSKEDYEELKNKYKVEAASTLKKIDDIQHQVSKVEVDDIEREISFYRKKEANIQINNEDTEQVISAFRSASSNKNIENKCSQCGTEYNSEDLFCSKCGAKRN